MQGIDVEALSINPFWYEAERDVVEKLIRYKRSWPSSAPASRAIRWAGVGHCSTRLAAQQLEDGAKKYGLRAR
jgi:aminocarboxymuconate-semialdehyde decarboxylase